MLVVPWLGVMVGWVWDLVVPELGVIMGWVWDLVMILLLDISSCVTGTAGVNGVSFLRNLLFLWVNCLLPWILTMYASCGRTSTTMPDLFHLPGLPLDWDWSWTATTSPMDSGGRGLAPCFSQVSIFPCLLARALALRSASRRHSCLGWYLLTKAGT